MSKQISINVHIKFRFWGQDLGKIERTWNIPLPASVPVAPHQLFHEDKDGVQITVSLA